MTDEIGYLGVLLAWLFPHAIRTSTKDYNLYLHIIH